MKSKAEDCGREGLSVGKTQMATIHYVCSTLNRKTHTRTFMGIDREGDEGGIGKFIDDFQKNIQIWFRFPLRAIETESPPPANILQDTFIGILYVCSTAGYYLYGACVIPAEERLKAAHLVNNITHWTTVRKRNVSTIYCSSSQFEVASVWTCTSSGH